MPTLKSAPQQVSLAPFLVIRQAGLPFAAAADLAAPALAAHIRSLLAEERWLEAVATPLCDALFAAVQRIGDTAPDQRKLLINAKRDMHNGRMPQSPQAVVDALSPEQQAQFREWVRRLGALRHGWQTGPEVYGWWHDTVSTRMQGWAVHPGFARGVALASLSLHQKLREYTAMPVAEHAGRLRKLEPALAMYLTRSTTKISPFSTFTCMAAGAWDAGATEGAAWESTGRAAVRASMPAINHALLCRLAMAAARHPDLRGHVPVGLNPGLAMTETQYLAYGPYDQQGNRRVAFTGERLVAVPRSADVDRAVALAGAPAMTWSALVRRLSGRRNAAGAEALVALLVDAHVIAAAWQVADNAPDYPAALAHALAGVPGPLAAGLRAALGELSGLTRRYAAADPADCPGLLQRFSQVLEDACALLGYTPPGGVEPPQIFEDAAWAGARLRVNPRGFEPGLDGLRVIERLLPIFDRSHAWQLLVRDQFVQRHGPGGECSDVVAFLIDAYAHAVDAMENPDGQGTPVETAELTALRQAFAAGLRAATHEAGAAPEVALDTGWLAELAGTVPVTVQETPTAHCYHVQPLPEQGYLVLNDIMNGFAQGAARYAYLLDGREPGWFSDHLRGYLEGLLPDRLQFLELPGTFGFNASRRPDLAGLALAYPGVCTAGSQPQIQLADLSLRHSEAENRLLLEDRRTGQVLLPVNLGSLTAMLSPALFNALCMLTAVGSARLPVLQMLERGLGAEERQRTRSYPRVRIAGAVIARRSWVVPRSELPVRPKGTDDFAYMVQVERWRQAAGLPDQIFIRTTLDPAAVLFRSMLPGQEAGPTEIRDQQRKPQYVDFRSPVLVRVFEKHLDEVAEVLLVEEMLPGPSDLLAGPEGESSISEWLVELNRVPRE
ncbi:MAG: hypothetical protein JWN15_683 [Firmicutes bacterium]|nr:hypothetical protein [Bacillota bacterium]